MTHEHFALFNVIHYRHRRCRRHQNILEKRTHTLTYTSQCTRIHTNTCCVVFLFPPSHFDADFNIVRRERKQRNSVDRLKKISQSNRMKTRILECEKGCRKTILTKYQTQREKERDVYSERGGKKVYIYYIGILVIWVRCNSIHNFPKNDPDVA